MVKASIAAALLAFSCGHALAQGLVKNSTATTYTDAQAVAAAASAGYVTAAQAAAAAPVQRVCNLQGTVGLSAACISDFTTAASTAAQGVSAFTSPNLGMPNGAFVGHMLYTSPSLPLVINGSSSDQTIFSGSCTYCGSLTLPAAAFHVGAMFEIQSGGKASTSAVNLMSATDKVKIGGVTVATTSATGLPIGSSNIPFQADTKCMVLASGVSGSVFCFGSVTYGNGLTGIAPAVSYLTATGPVTVNLSAGATIDATVNAAGLGTATFNIYYSAVNQLN